MSISLLDRYRSIYVNISPVQGSARPDHPFGLLLLVLPGHVLKVFYLALGPRQHVGGGSRRKDADLGQGTTRVTDQIALPLLVSEWSHGDVRTEMVLDMLSNGSELAFFHPDAISITRQRRNNSTTLGTCLATYDLEQSVIEISHTVNIMCRDMP